ncbi:MAG: DUF721 domain-containing protein [Actinomycetota bacterium]|nr:DUF721 domain-containing protein [Actinomycetota bacterium]
MTWHPTTIGEAVLGQLSRFGPAGRIADVVAAWPEAVGWGIAEQAWPARIARDGTLTVTTSSSTWAFELTKLEVELRSRLDERLGETAPSRLRFVVGRLPERGGGEGAPTSRRTVPKAGPEARAAAAEIAASIENEELRTLVARAAAASLERGREQEDDRTLW